MEKRGLVASMGVVACFYRPRPRRCAVPSIDANMIRSALQVEWKHTQVTADRTRQRIEAVLDWAAVRTGRTGAPNPARWKGNLQHVLRSTAEVKHHEALPYEQAPEFMARLRARNTPSAKAFEFAILTA